MIKGSFKATGLSLSLDSIESNLWAVSSCTSCSAWGKRTHMILMNNQWHTIGIPEFNGNFSGCQLLPKLSKLQCGIIHPGTCRVYRNKSWLRCIYSDAQPVNDVPQCSPIICHHAKQTFWQEIQKYISNMPKWWGKNRCATAISCS